MADLDDFFAKKDKKKSKAKKFLTTDEFVKKLEDTSKRDAPAAPKKEVAPKVVPAEGGAGDDQPQVQQPHEEEWKEFQEEERKDYTGLKIGQLTIEQSNNAGQSDDEDGHDYDGSDNEDGESSGPWKKVIPAEEVTQIPVEIEKPSGNKVYISPALRNAQMGTPRPMKNRTAPDITNEDYFPTLGAARPEEQKKKKNEPAFEEVRHGGRAQRVPEAQNTTAASVTNRFRSLEEDDS